jgi:hypothetical protein
MSADLPDQQAANEALPLLLSMTGISKSFPASVRLTVLASMSGRVKSTPCLVRMAREIDAAQDPVGSAAAGFRDHYFRRRAHQPV